MKIKAELESNDLKDIREVLTTWMGISPSDEQIRDLMKYENDILIDIANWGANDTPTREKIMKAVGERITKMRYPRHKDSQKYMDEFWDIFNQKAVASGIKVVVS
ncbi:MAG: hypothetical protein DWQ19_10825 [Crenarchaeota archaeon]|nr:MAG: hypothetical protein DWQ19_10825 [Thermoproteota archaeon]